MTQEQAKSTNSSKPNSKPSTKKRKAAVPRWAKITRIVLTYAGIPVLFLLCLYIGLYIGYVRLGDQPAHEILQWETWKHVYDLVFAEG